MAGEATISFRVRHYATADRDVCRRLFVEGLINGKNAASDCGVDIDDIETSYTRPGGRFWVAELSEGPFRSEVVGMIGVQLRDDGSAEIRRLRVDERFRRRGIGFGLMDEAVRFCQHEGNLKVILDTYLDREPAIRLFERFHFRHSRTRRVGEKDKLYFYLDFYGRDGSGEQEPSFSA